MNGGTTRAVAGARSGRPVAGWLLAALALAWIGLGGSLAPLAPGADGSRAPVTVASMQSLDSGPAPAWSASRLQIAPVARATPGSPFVPPLLPASPLWAGPAPLLASLPLALAPAAGRLPRGGLGSRAPPSSF